MSIFEDLADWASQEAINIYNLIKYETHGDSVWVEMLFFSPLKFFLTLEEVAVTGRSGVKRYNDAIKGRGMFKVWLKILDSCLCGLNSTQTAKYLWYQGSWIELILPITIQ